MVICSAAIRSDADSWNACATCPIPTTTTSNMARRLPPIIAATRESMPGNRGARDPVFPNCSTKHAHKTESRDARPEHVTRTQTGWQDLLKRGRGQNKLCPRHLTPSPTHTTRPHTQGCRRSGASADEFIRREKWGSPDGVRDHGARGWICEARRDAVKKALEVGYRHIDTAELYQVLPLTPKRQHHAKTGPNMACEDPDARVGGESDRGVEDQARGALHHVETQGHAMWRVRGGEGARGLDAQEDGPGPL
eukprot:1765435-Rhodomonas_salina.7